MYKIRVASVENPNVYRVFSVFPNQTLFDLEYVITTGFEDLGDLDSVYEAKRKNGQLVNETIYTFPEDEGDLDTDDELLSDWLVVPGDELMYCEEDQVEITIQLEQIIDEQLPSEICLEGKGTLQKPNQKIDINEITMLLGLKEKMNDLDFSDFENMIDPDYETLLQLSDELNKMKPWQYFSNTDIIAFQLAESEETFFVAVMGAGGEEFGLMMYEDEFGYDLLEAVLLEKPLELDAHIGLSGFVVNFVDRTELEKADYQLIKDCGMTFRGKNKWIQFRSYNPGTFPTIPSFIEVEMLKELVQAMIQITEKRMQGWEYPAVPVRTYPAFNILEGDVMGQGYLLEVKPSSKGDLEIELTDIERAQYKRKQKAALPLEFDLFYLPYTMPSVEDEELLIYPVVCVAFDRTTGEAIYHDVLPFPKVAFTQQQMFWQLLKELPIRPSKVYVSKEIKEVLGQLAKLLGVELVQSELPNVQSFKEMIATVPPMDF